MANELLLKEIGMVNWTNGIVSKEEAERFVARFAKVLLDQAMVNKEKKDKTTNANRYN